MKYIIADDLSGANDTGVKFTKKGYNAIVSIMNKQPTIVIPDNIDVFVVDTETRKLENEHARKKLNSILKKLRIDKDDFVYKKVDSTMRGNIGAEIEEIMKFLRKDICIFSPSFPSLQRITVGGYLLVQQKPLGFSEYSNNPLVENGDNSFIPFLLKKQTNFSIGQIDLKEVSRGKEVILSKINELHKKGNKIIVVDSTNEEHLKDIFASSLKFNGSVLFSGSAGLANHFSQIFTKKEKSRKNINNKGPIAVVVGSRNPVAMTQVEYLKEKIDFEAIKIDLENVFSNKEKIVNEYALKGVTAAKNNQHLLIYTDAVYNDKEKINKKLMLEYHLGFRDLEVNIKKIFGEIVLKVFQNSNLRNLILTGGDVALGVCKELGISNLTILDELLPGIPLSLACHENIYLNIMTKAGGFGEADTLYRLVTKFKNYE